MKRFSPSVLGVIPARYASTRLPGKPLCLIHGKPMVEWVYKAAQRALPHVIVATDDQRVVSVVQRFGGDARLTPRSCKSGTDRMAAVAKKVFAHYYVNIQGDEPLIHPSTIRKAVELAIQKKAIATPMTTLDPRDQKNPNVVKVVVGAQSRALYFSRSFVPYPRDGDGSFTGFKHLGLYVYPRAALFQFVRLKPPPLEGIEKLEQLRALYYRMPIYMSYTAHDSIGVDTPRDLKVVIQRLKAKGVSSR